MKPEDRIGQKIADKYRIDEIIGSGGMGVVYRAQHEWTDRPVAVKVLRKEVVDDDDVVSRFLREAKAAAALKHPNVVDVLDMGREEDTVYLVLELLEGEPLSELIARDGALDVADTVRLLTPVLSAIGKAHDRGIVHRDIKPENIFVCKDGDGGRIAKLLDFGIAKLTDNQQLTPSLTRTGTIIGTPQYMSPEQVAAKDVGPKTDVWSMGIVLYECLSGDVPWGDTDSVASVLAQIYGQHPKELQVERVPQPVAETVMWALEHEAEARPTIKELADGLRSAVEQNVSIAPSREVSGAPTLNIPGMVGGGDGRTSSPDAELGTRETAATPMAWPVTAKHAAAQVEQRPMMTGLIGGLVIGLVLTVALGVWLAGGRGADNQVDAADVVAADPVSAAAAGPDTTGAEAIPDGAEAAAADEEATDPDEVDAGVEDEGAAAGPAPRPAPARRVAPRPRRRSPNSTPILPAE